MKYYFYMYIAISLILLSIATFKVGFSITLVFLLLFIAVTAMACVDNIKTLATSGIHYIPIIIFAVLYNVYTSFDKLTDTSNILIFAFHLGFSFIVPWLIFTLINIICDYKNITNIFSINHTVILYTKRNNVKFFTILYF